MKNNGWKPSKNYKETSLRGLLKVLTADVVKLKKQAAERYKYGEEWFAVDVAIVSDHYEVLLAQRRENTVFATTRFGETTTDLHSALPDLHRALREELLTVPALLDAVNNATTEDQVRYRLSNGLRTPHSKERGFRWDLIDGDHYEAVRPGLIRDDIDRLASMLSFQDADVVVEKLTATTEKISIFTSDGKEFDYLPFDFYPFLGVEILRQDNQETTGEHVAELNNVLVRLYEAMREDRLAEEHEEARMRGEITEDIWRHTN